MKQFNAVAYLETLHTKQILGLKNSIHKLSQWSHKMEDGVLVRDKQYSGILYLCERSDMKITMADIKKVLLNRPHVPNYKEAKVLRQERATFGKKNKKKML